MPRFSWKWFQYFTVKSVIATISHSKLFLALKKKKKGQYAWLSLTMDLIDFRSQKRVERWGLITIKWEFVSKTDLKANKVCWREREGELLYNICTFPVHIFTRALWGKQQIEVFWDNFNQFLLGKLSNSCCLKPHHPWKSICSTRNPLCIYGEDNSNSQHMLDLKDKNVSYL